MKQGAHVSEQAHSLHVESTVDAACSGDHRAVARLISLVENNSPLLPRLSAALVERNDAVPAQHVIGLTGAPGVGKSTCTTALLTVLRARGKRVGVLAVDPSSPFSGGALLGDRVRMQEFATDTGVFIRSMASRGHLGGLALAAPLAVRVLEGVGFDVVIVETVGVGQGEVEIAGLADTTLVLLAPGMGDGIQATKAGILEIADIFVVNKADRDGADRTVRDVKNMLALGGPHSAAGSWRPVVVKTVSSAATSLSLAAENGIEELIAAIDKHYAWLDRHELVTQRRRARVSAEISHIALATMRERFAAVSAENSLETLAEHVARGKLDPYAAAARLITAAEDVEPG